MSATASRKVRRSSSGSGSRSGPAPASGTACASGGIAAARRRTASTSWARSGPVRQASWSPGDSPGSSSPRATRCRACIAAAPQNTVDRCPSAPARARVRTGSAARTGSRTAGTLSASTPSPPGTTTVRSATEAGTHGRRGRPSGRQKATRPVRAGSPGRNTARQRASSEDAKEGAVEDAEEGAGRVGCSAMADSSNLTSGSEPPSIQHFWRTRVWLGCELSHYEGVRGV